MGNASSPGGVGGVVGCGTGPTFYTRLGERILWLTYSRCLSPRNLRARDRLQTWRGCGVAYNEMEYARLARVWVVRRENISVKGRGQRYHWGRRS